MCPEKEYPFSGFPEQTLCDENPNFVCGTQIGTGTAFPKSSLIGASITGNVCIVGDFEVDASFRFQNAVVKINPGVKISIAGNQGTLVGVPLEIDNSRLFACDGLWKGIELGFYSYIATYNHSEIEDAEKAIFSNVPSTLSFETTTFNRNRVGIELVAPHHSTLVGPLLWSFAGNRFTCNAPLNGTLDEVTFAGIKLEDIPLYTFQTSWNFFTDIQYGVYSEGSASYIGMRQLIFLRIKRDGIYMEHGNLDLRNSRFENCEEKGINIASVNNVVISDNCTFIWDDILPLTSPTGFSIYYGIYVQSFSVGSWTNIEESYFSAELTSGQKRVFGINFEGTNAGGGTAIHISQCTLHMYGGPAIGLRINGDFPSESQIDINNNDFDIQNQLNAGSPYCIYSTGNRYDFDIIGNRFYNELPKYGWASGIYLQGSEGNENEVSENHFEPGLLYQSYLCGVEAQDFKNTTYCSNTFLDASRAFCFSGYNDGTDFTNNIVYGANLITIHDQSWIEDQDQKGNQWTRETPYGFLGFTLTPHSECKNPDYAQYSEFFVHTPQSTSTYGAGFSPYHPKNIVPDNNDEWWSQQNGTPAGTCIVEFTNPGNGDTRLKRAVADGTLAAQFNNPSMIWQAERALYFALKRDTALTSTYAAYTTFLATKAGSNIDKFYQTAIALDAARNGSATLVVDAQNNRTAINNLLVEIEAADQAWQTAATPAEEEAAKNAKQQKLGELTGLLQTASDLLATYKQNLQTALANVQQINNSVVPASDWEAYEKTANSIFINYLQNEGITQEQKQQLEMIAEVCPKYGGMGVYRVRGLLPECTQPLEWDNYEGCYPAPAPASVDSVEVEPRSFDNAAVRHIANTQVTPNPTNETATVNIPQGKQADIRLVNAFGQSVLEQKMASLQTTFSVNHLPIGIYYLEVLFTDGHRECLKLVVSR